MNIMDTFLHEYSQVHYGWACVIFALVLCASMYGIARQKRLSGERVTVKNWLGGIVFAVYLVLLFGGTLLNRTPGTINEVELQPFWSYWAVMVEGDGYLWPQMLYNVLAFIPWGFLLPILFDTIKSIKRIICSTVVLSATIEFLQLIFKCGLFEFDDIIHNTLGAVLGFVLWKILLKKSPRPDS